MNGKVGEDEHNDDLELDDNSNTKNNHRGSSPISSLCFANVEDLYFLTHRHRLMSSAVQCYGSNSGSYSALCLSYCWFRRGCGHSRVYDPDKVLRRRQSLYCAITPKSDYSANPLLQFYASGGRGEGGCHMPLFAIWFGNTCWPICKQNSKTGYVL